MEKLRPKKRRSKNEQKKLRKMRMEKEKVDKMDMKSFVKKGRQRWFKEKKNERMKGKEETENDGKP